MTTTAAKPRVTSFAPQFLVDDLERSIGYYEKLGFQDERRHRRDNEHLDAAPDVIFE
jgi:hypothetical protein